jgi:energy-converting hydrogenase Eha subunit C
MNLLLIVSAIAGFGSAIGHSYLSQRFVLRPLYAKSAGNRILEDPIMRTLMYAMWHLPSLTWALVAAATLWLALAPAAFDPTARVLLLYFGIGIYMSAALWNAIAFRRPHIGNILLTIASLALWFGVNP